jgi:uncharacterized membrane protein YfcA
MHFHLPVADMSANTLVSGLLGVGGGFQMAPQLIFSGIPSANRVPVGGA